MMMSCIWFGMMALSVLYGAASGNSAAVGAAAADGAQEAVKFVIATGGAICLWCGVMEVMERSGVSAALSRLLRPALRRLFPACAAHGDIMDAVSANVSANLLGLGNAATPMGIRAAQGMAALGEKGAASDELCMLVVINTASIQLLPTTTAAVRAACGAAAPFDILPAVWISTVLSVGAGLASARLFSRLSR